MFNNITSKTWHDVIGQYCGLHQMGRTKPHEISPAQIRIVVWALRAGLSEQRKKAPTFLQWVPIPKSSSSKPISCKSLYLLVHSLKFIDLGRSIASFPAHPPLKQNSCSKYPISPSVVYSFHPSSLQKIPLNPFESKCWEHIDWQIG